MRTDTYPMTIEITDPILKTVSCHIDVGPGVVWDDLPLDLQAGLYLRAKHMAARAGLTVTVDVLPDEAPTIVSATLDHRPIHGSLDQGDLDSLSRAIEEEMIQAGELEGAR